jgi:hypothetical protein
MIELLSDFKIVTDYGSENIDGRERNLLNDHIAQAIK